MDEENYDFEFDVDFLFDHIELVIGGNTIDILYDEQIKIYNIIYALKVEKISSKFYFPIPFYCMNNDYGLFAYKCSHHDIIIKIKFSSNEFVKMIKSPVIRTEIIPKSEAFDFSILNTYSYKYFFTKMMKKNSPSDLLYYKKEFEKCQQYVKIKNNQFYGIENLQQNSHSVKIRNCFNHYIDRFFIYFQNPNDKSIYTNTQQFETIKFIIEGNIILEYDYTSLLNNNLKNILGYELPNGIFEIKWNINEHKNFFHN